MASKKSHNALYRHYLYSCGGLQTNPEIYGYGVLILPNTSIKISLTLQTYHKYQNVPSVHAIHQSGIFPVLNHYCKNHKHTEALAQKKGLLAFTELTADTFPQSTNAAIESVIMLVHYLPMRKLIERKVCRKDPRRSFCCSFKNRQIKALHGSNQENTGNSQALCTATRHLNS